MSLNFRYPLGNPSSPTCRWCKMPRVEHRHIISAPRVLICRTCDVPSPSTSITTINSTEEST